MRRRDTETICHCGAAYNGSDHCPVCGCEQYETITVRDCGHNMPMYTVGTARPYTGVVCHGDRHIGRVTTQRRQRGERYYTATPTMPDGSYAPTASLGTRFPTFMAAARALWRFDREWHGPNRANDRALMSSAVMDFREVFGVVPGRKFSRLGEFA
jgi:hypothetical protein